jgi:triosephosphate isomerase
MDKAATSSNHIVRVPFIVGNWKMHKTLATASNDLVHIGTTTRVYDGHSHPSDYHGGGGLRVAIAPVALHLADLCRVAPRHLDIFAQNVHWEDTGAFTGEHSPTMLAELRVRGSIVAHSERRQHFGETNESAGKKIRALLNAGLEVIYCVGETAAQRSAGLLKNVLQAQIHEAVQAASNLDWGACLTSPGLCRFNIAYEPVWAIGTGKAATEIEAQEAHVLIRNEIALATNPVLAQSTRILYGGSVKPENIGRFMAAPDVDGALVGGASLDPDSFEGLCRATAKTLEIKHP